MPRGPASAAQEARSARGPAPLAKRGRQFKGHLCGGPPTAPPQRNQGGDGSGHLKHSSSAPSLDELRQCCGMTSLRTSASPRCPCGASPCRRVGQKHLGHAESLRLPRLRECRADALPVGRARALGESIWRREGQRVGLDGSPDLLCWADADTESLRGTHGLRHRL